MFATFGYIKGIGLMLACQHFRTCLLAWTPCEDHS